MIRVRGKDGRTTVLDPGTRFVEICDAEGRVGLLLYFDDAGVMHQVDGSSPEARTYGRLFKTVFCPTSVLRS